MTEGHTDVVTRNSAIIVGAALAVIFTLAGLDLVGAVIATGLVATSIVAGGEIAESSGWIETGERTESPHDCPACGSEELYSRPVSEASPTDRLIARMPFEYRCRSCNWEGYGPGPAAEMDKPDLTTWSRVVERLKVWK